jgi:L-threonylcarbamoyladenylate synthase
MSIISKDISKAVQLLSDGDIIAIPTETVYGLAGNIFNENAIRQIFKTKERPLFNPLIVHIAKDKPLATVARHVPKKAQELADAFWPGPLTLVLKKQDAIPDIVTAGKDTVAVRVPNHNLTQDLLKRLNFPIAAPSANPFGSISPTKAAHVDHYFKTKIKMVLDGGACHKGIESTIIGFEDDQPIIYRLGAISLEAIEKVIGKIALKNTDNSTPNAPGMLDRHYAPSTLTIRSNRIMEDVLKHKGKRIGVLTFTQVVQHENIEKHIALSKSGHLEEAMAQLYDALHQLDSLNLDLIITEIFPDHDLGKSINDRLKRATYSS